MPGISRFRRAVVAFGASVPLLLVGLPTSPAHASNAAPVSAAFKPQKTALHTTIKAHKKAPRPEPRVLRALSVAMHQQGDPYRYGAAGPGSFDCSGLVYYSTRAAGIHGVPRTSSAQSGYMRHISRAAMRRGDFVFFNSGGGVYHVGIYLGMSHGRRVIVHAPYPGASVRREAIWTNGWFPGTLRGR
jgi:cell wall-associated NlpC family hydrolase